MSHGLIWFNPLNDLWHSFNLQNNSDGINSFYFCLSYVISSLVVLLHSIHLNNPFMYYLLAFFICRQWLLMQFHFFRIQVFSAFGFVHKIATFEKAAGFQVFVQRICASWFMQVLFLYLSIYLLSEENHISTGFDPIQWFWDCLFSKKCIGWKKYSQVSFLPILRISEWQYFLLQFHETLIVTYRYLLPEHVNACHLRISFSAHTDLNIKFQSHRSRYYPTHWQHL